jgi:PAS domain S-box-containing protein
LYVFRLGFSRRFATLESNVRRLAAGEKSPPIRGGDEIARLDLAFRDLTAELMNKSGEVRDLYDNAPCGYHSLAADGTFVMVNATELGWLGYAAEEMLGRMKFPELLTERSRQVFLDNFSQFKRVGAVHDLEFEMIRKDGSVFPILLNASSVRDAKGNYIRSRTTLIDITERKRAEDAMRRLSEGLEESVRARTSELAEAYRELIHRNSENEMFVYSVSHDLRSPLVNLQGFSRELEKGSQGLAGLLEAEAVPAEIRDRARSILSGKMNQSLGFIRNAVLRLSGIIDALLRLSRAGRVEYRWQTIDMDRLAAHVVGATQSTITERGASVRVGRLPTTWGDRNAVEQLLANLVANALTYLDPTRPGQIEIGCLPQGAREISDGFHGYYVRDNGLGIAEAHQQKIFQAFQRAHPGVGSGEGLGLAIVARVAERHRGRVWVESCPGQGSTFFFALPAAPNTPSLT